MGEGAQFYNTEYRSRKKRRQTVRISELLEQFMSEQVSPRQARYGAIVEVWERILPDELAKHCSIVDISSGQLTVEVDSPAYKYELHLCRSELLAELQRQCPSARLSNIKFIVGQVT